MAATAVVTITGQVSGGPSGSKNLSGQIQSTSAVMNVATANLASGNTTIGAPSGATAVLITPAAGNTVAIILKGVNGDTGIKLHLTNPTLVCIDPTVGSIVINAASLTGLFEFNWF